MESFHVNLVLDLENMKASFQGKIHIIIIEQFHQNIHENDVNNGLHIIIIYFIRYVKDFNELLSEARTRD